jgi:hypothetical protein
VQGTASLSATAAYTDVPFEMDIYSKISMVFLLFTLVATSVVVVLNNFEFPRK